MRKLDSRFGAVVIFCASTTMVAAEEAQLELGRQVFTETAEPQCAICHTLADAEAVGEVGPILDDLKPTADVVHAAVLNGIGSMPSYAELLTEEEIAAVAAYVAAATGAAASEGTASPPASGTEAEVVESLPSEEPSDGSDLADTTQAEAEVSEEQAPAPAATAEAGIEAVALDLALVGEGEGVFRRCVSCHEVGEGAENRVGPVLNGVVERLIGTYPDFRYSDVLEGAGLAGRVWSVEELSAYLADPQEHMPGTKMSFPGLRSDDDIAAVIEFLRSHAE